MLAETGIRTGFGLYLRPREYHNRRRARSSRPVIATLWFSASTAGISRTRWSTIAERGRCCSRRRGRGGQRRVPGNFLLQWSIIRWAAGAGFWSYDLGGVDNHATTGLPTDESHPLWNLFRFKRAVGRPPDPVRWRLGIRPMAGVRCRAARRPGAPRTDCAAAAANRVAEPTARARSDPQGAALELASGAVGSVGSGVSGGNSGGGTSMCLKSDLASSLMVFEGQLRRDC